MIFHNKELGSQSSLQFIEFPYIASDWQLIYASNANCIVRTRHCRWRVLQRWIWIRIWIWIWITCTSNSIVNSSSLVELSLWWRRHDIDRRQPIDFWQAAATSSGSTGTREQGRVSALRSQLATPRRLWAILMTFCQADWRQRVDMRLAHKSSSPARLLPHLGIGAQLAGIMPTAINNAILNWPSMGQ